MKIERQIPTKIKGTTFRQVPFEAIRPGDQLELCREFDNPVDHNAIQVVHSGILVGYISRDLAAQLAQAMDDGCQVHGKVDAVTGGTVDAPNRGINITVTSVNEVPDQAFAGVVSR